MQAFKSLTTKTVAMPAANIDTDQIIPARFLKVTTKEGLGEKAFHDWRYEKDGSDKADFILNTQAAAGAQALIAGDNFGCGSSREHAPWALLDYGFRIVISTRIADIFKNNALKNGLLPIVVDDAFHTRLLAAAGEAITVDLNACTVTNAKGETCSFTVEPFARFCMLQGQDQMDYLLAQDSHIQSFEKQREVA